MTNPEEWESRIQDIIRGFPSPYREEILEIWFEWLKANPESPYYQSWNEFSSKIDDQDALYTETRVYLRKVKNELRESEMPLNLWQKVAKALAAVASVFLVIFLALSRAMRVTE
ncbi:MAG: hypothetical protein ACFFDQ_12235 [Candidatus Thorarchaeota archaeon]